MALLSCLLFLLWPASALADPLVENGQQDWLRRVVPADLSAPAVAQIPPIAIIETGFDSDHPDMQGGWVVQRRYGPAPTNDEELVDFAEGIAHGTAVAGIIGAPRDGAGLEGVLPGARVWVYGSSGLCRDVAAAVRQAVRDGAGVINVSGGFEAPGACLAFRNATSWAFGRGVLTVAAAGNYRPHQRWIQPGSDYHVLTVGALNTFDQPAGFSQQTIYLDLMAPGEGILGASPIWWDTTDGAPDGYERLSGTSFSAPMVAAAAAWILAQRPRLTADQVANILRYSARDFGRRGWDRAYGWGALDLLAALAYPAPRHDYFEPNDEIRWVNGGSGFTADAPLLGRRRSQLVAATLDVAKDPRDFYRVSVPIGGSAKITVISPDIAVDLFVWQPSARRASERGALVARSIRSGTRSEVVRITNYGARQPAFIEVRARRGADLAGTYRLRLRRVR